MPMRLRSLALPIVLAAAAAAPARANDIRIYHGVVESGFWTTITAEVKKQRVYLVVDHTAFELGLIYYDPQTRMHSETTLASTFDAARPTAADPDAQWFIYGGVPEPGTPVDVYRLRSAGKLALQPISSS